MPSRSDGTIVAQTEDHGTVTIAVDANTRVNGEHASTLADLAKATGHKVEVQARKRSGNTPQATKVTVQGKEDEQDGTETPEPTHTPEATEVPEGMQTPKATETLGTMNSIYATWRSRAARGRVCARHTHSPVGDRALSRLGRQSC